MLPIRNLEKFVLCCSLLIFGLTLYTNQYFHGGVFGTLHNKSVKPKIEISDASFVNSQLKFQVYRTEGADVYGSFLIGMQVLNAENRLVFEMNADALSTFDSGKIHNYYVAKVKTGKHSMVIPLGAKADLTVDIPADRLAKSDRYTLKLIDISGAEWRSTIAYN